MYTLAVRRDFIARHYLTGGDWGLENFPNSHQYLIELQLSGASLDEHGYLCDIVEVERHLDEVVGRYREAMLNDLPEFAGINPSIEHFGRILCTTFSERIPAAQITKLKVVLWENEKAWVSFKINRE
ncbi:MAG TPA: 6-carboxytetrahydropterin synthase [Anaerolineales bacterium]|jgi:6-pyruvoyltetrahydropterin/6-carboxytetrahydropterin synthase